MNLLTFVIITCYLISCGYSETPKDTERQSNTNLKSKAKKEPTTQKHKIGTKEKEIVSKNPPIEKSCNFDGECSSGVCHQNTCLFKCLQTEHQCPLNQRCLPLPHIMYSDTHDKPTSSVGTPKPIKICQPEEFSFASSQQIMNTFKQKEFFKSKWLHIWLPSSQYSFQLSTHSSLDSYHGVSELFDPLGLKLFDVSSIDNINQFHKQKIRFVPGNGQTSLFIPNSDRISTRKGWYSLRLISKTAENLRASLAFKKSSFITKKRQLKINLIFVSPGTLKGSNQILNSSNYKTQKEFIKIWAKFKSLMAKVDLEIKILSAKDYLAKDQMELSKIDDRGQRKPQKFKKLISSYKSKEKFVLPIYFIKEFCVFGVQYPCHTMQGLSSGIPGVSPIIGHFKGGVAIAIQRNSERGSDIAGQVIAHEVAHFLGLYHTYELTKNYTIHDPLKDTPEKQSCNVMDPSVLGCYRSGHGNHNHQWSATQKAILNRNVYVQ